METIANQELIDRGIKAQRFREYLAEDGYFIGLIERMKDRQKANLISLNYHAVDSFRVLRAQLDVLDWYLEAIDADIALGRLEAEKRDGTTGKEGIL